MPDVVSVPVTVSRDAGLVHEIGEQLVLAWPASPAAACSNMPVVTSSGWRCHRRSSAGDTTNRCIGWPWSGTRSSRRRVAIQPGIPQLEPQAPIRRSPTASPPAACRRSARSRCFRRPPPVAERTRRRRRRPRRCRAGDPAAAAGAPPGRLAGVEPRLARHRRHDR